MNSEENFVSQEESIAHSPFRPSTPLCTFSPSFAREMKKCPKCREVIVPVSLSPGYDSAAMDAPTQDLARAATAEMKKLTAGSSPASLPSFERFLESPLYGPCTTPLHGEEHIDYMKVFSPPDVRRFYSPLNLCSRFEREDSPTRLGSSRSFFSDKPFYSESRRVKKITVSRTAPDFVETWSSELVHSSPGRITAYSTTTILSHARSRRQRPSAEEKIETVPTSQVSSSSDALRAKQKEKVGTSSRASSCSKDSRTKTKKKSGTTKKKSGKAKKRSVNPTKFCVGEDVVIINGPGEGLQGTVASMANGYIAVCVAQGQGAAHETKEGANKRKKKKKKKKHDRRIFKRWFDLKSLQSSDHPKIPGSLKRKSSTMVNEISNGIWSSEEKSSLQQALTAVQNGMKRVRRKRSLAFAA